MKKLPAKRTVGTEIDVSSSKVAALGHHVLIDSVAARADRDETSWFQRRAKRITGRAGSPVASRPGGRNTVGRSRSSTAAAAVTRRSQRCVFEEVTSTTKSHAARARASAWRTRANGIVQPPAGEIHRRARGSGRGTTVRSPLPRTTLRARSTAGEARNAGNEGSRAGPRVCSSTTTEPGLGRRLHRGAACCARPGLSRRAGDPGGARGARRRQGADLHILLTEHGMPGMSGRENLARDLVQEHPQVPVVVYVGVPRPSTAPDWAVHRQAVRSPTRWPRSRTSRPGGAKTGLTTRVVRLFFAVIQQLVD